jgi:hypothetical protein
LRTLRRERRYRKAAGPPPGLIVAHISAGEAVRPVDHFAAFCESLTQSEDRWEGQPLKLEPWLA